MNYHVTVIFLGINGLSYIIVFTLTLLVLDVLYLPNLYTALVFNGVVNISYINCTSSGLEYV